MPSRNIVRLDSSDSYYHVYARGINKQPIFSEPSDFSYFMYLLERYLAKKQSKSKQGILYPNYHGAVGLMTFCLMKNHFHLLIYQRDKGALRDFMKSLMVSYSRYFNLKYTRRGPLFESRYKASKIESDQYLEHISRYIHLNPRSWKYYKYSSIKYFRKGKKPDWLDTDKVLGYDQKNQQEYMTFLEDYEDHKKMLHEIKDDLADI